MSEATHTPGPWDYCRPGRWWKVYARSAVNDGIDEFITEQIYDKANARLIAAAPEMLEALKRAEQFIRNGIELGFIRMPDPETPDTAHQTPGIINGAIAKATGAQ